VDPIVRTTGAVAIRWLPQAQGAFGPRTPNARTAPSAHRLLAARSRSASGHWGSIACGSEVGVGGSGARFASLLPMQETAGPIERFMVGDHAELDRFLAASERDDGTIDQPTYTQFRHDLLRHIAMEEKVLLPYARARRGGEALPLAFQLRRDHTEIAKLLARPPSIERLATLREILGRHNALEEGPDGLYAACDELAGRDASSIVERLRAQPHVPLAPYYDGPPHRARPR
jgi:hypothetical protein